MRLKFKKAENNLFRLYETLFGFVTFTPYSYCPFAKTSFIRDYDCENHDCENYGCKGCFYESEKRNGDRSVPDDPTFYFTYKEMEHELRRFAYTAENYFYCDIEIIPFVIIFKN